MNQKPDNDYARETLEEYDFSEGVRGKYAARFAQGVNVGVLDPDVAEVFTDSESVNQELRALAGIIQRRSEKAHP
jgi:hypothetical protein